MLDETTPATASEENVANEAPAAEAKPAKKAAAKKAPAKKAAAKKAPAKKAAAKKTAAPAAEAPAAETTAAEASAETSAEPGAGSADVAPAKKAPARRTRKAPAKKVAAAAAAESAPEAEAAPEAAPAVEAEAKPAKKAAAKKAPAKKAAAKKAPAKKAAAKKTAATAEVAVEAAPVEAVEAEAVQADADASGTIPLFQAPEAVKKPARRTRKRAAAPVVEETPAVALPVSVEGEEDEDAAATEAAAEAAAEAVAEAAGEGTEEVAAEATDETPDASAESETVEADTTDESDAQDDAEAGESDEAEDGTPSRRRRRRGGRRRRKSSQSAEGTEAAETTEEAASESGDDTEAAAPAAEGESDEQGEESAEGGSSSRRRRRRRRAGDSDASTSDDPENTVVRVREARKAEDQITAVTGSTRLEAKKQRRREGREAGRRRAPIVSEAEFLARREAVERVMVIRQRPDVTQIAVLEDKVLVEHYVARESQTSLIGNVYLGRVQNVLPSMEAAFVDIGKGRNAVLYAGEVNWAALGHKDGKARKIESVLSPGQPILVQVTKDPVGHKGARLTSQVSLAGRFLVYVPDGTTSGISRKLPDTERARLKTLLKEIVPESAGVIVRTAAEGASEEELTSDVERLKARWEDIERKAQDKGKGAQLLYGEPDLTLKVVRDLFTEDFSKLVIEGEDAWQTVQGYVEHVAPDLAERLEKYEPADAVSAQQGDVFTKYRIDEQIAKGLDRKVWLPSGGSLVIDRTEAMTVVDVNTGKFTGSGGNLEETVTKNNLEAAEEIVRQLRLRDIGGIIVVDFIDMVLESNRDLVLRRMVECLGRDRTRHQVAEVTSLGLVQMTRKRIGTGLLEAFSTDCDHCNGRGIVTHAHPIETRSGSGDEDGRRGRRNRGKGDKGEKQNTQQKAAPEAAPEMAQENVDVAPEQATQAPVSEPAVEAQTAESSAPEVTAESATSASTSETTAAAAEQPVEGERRSRNRGRSRNRSRSSERQENASTEETPAPAEPAVVAEVAEPTPAVAEQAPVAEPAVQAPAAPKVVTSTRTRRGASRAVSTTTTLTPTPVAEMPVVPAFVPVAAGSAEGAESRPTVVTRTRVRGGARSAEPASAPASTPASAASEESGVEHVPVKNKGTRKR